MIKKKRRKKKTGIRRFENLIIITIMVVYMFFSAIVFYSMSQTHTDVLGSISKTRISSVWLDSVPYHQPFNASKTVGIRIYLTNPYNVSEGVVSVRVGDQQTGNVLYETELLVTEITDSVLEDYIDIIPDNMNFDDDTVYYLELDALSCAEQSIKAFLVGTDQYGVSHAGDESDLTKKMLCFAVIQETIPFLFIIWIFITSLVVLMLTLVFSGNRKKAEYKAVKLPTSLESKIVIPVLILIGLLGTGVLSIDEFRSKTVDIKDEALTGGYELKEHSNYCQEFTVKSDNLKEIHVSLDIFFENVGTFVISIQKGQDEIVSSVQNIEIDKVDGSYYSWDVSSLGLKKGETYDLYIYTGFIGEDEENPVINGIEYIYSK